MKWKSGALWVHSVNCVALWELRIKGKLHNITFVNVYALAEDTEDEIVDEFYETLQSVCDELPKHDAVITLGDFNATLGKEYIYTDTAYMTPQVIMDFD